MDEESHNTSTSKKPEMFIISPQELLQLGLLKKVPTPINSPKPTTSSTISEPVAGSSVQPEITEGPDKISNSPKPLVLNHVLKMKGPVVKIRKFIKKKYPSRFILQTDGYKKNTILVAKKSLPTLSHEAAVVKNILLSSAKTNRLHEPIFPTVDSSNHRTTVLIQRKGLPKNILRSHGILRASNIVTRKVYKKIVKSAAPNNSIVPNDGSNISDGKINLIGSDDKIETMSNSDATNINNCMIHKTLVNNQKIESIASTSSATSETEDNLEKDAPSNPSSSIDKHEGGIKLAEPIKILSDEQVRIPIKMLKELTAGTKLKTVAIKKKINIMPSEGVTDEKDTKPNVFNENLMKIEESTSKIKTGIIVPDILKITRSKPDTNAEQNESKPMKQIFKLTGMSADFYAKILAAKPGDTIYSREDSINNSSGVSEKLKPKGILKPSEKKTKKNLVLTKSDLKNSNTQVISKSEIIPNDKDIGKEAISKPVDKVASSDKTCKEIVDGVLGKPDEDATSTPNEPIKKRSRKNPIIMKSDDQFESFESEILILDKEQRNITSELLHPKPEKKKRISEKDNKNAKNENTESKDNKIKSEPVQEVIKINNSDHVSNDIEEIFPSESTNETTESFSQDISETSVLNNSKIDFESLSSKEDNTSASSNTVQVVKKKGRPRKKPLESVDDKIKISEVTEGESEVKKPEILDDPLESEAGTSDDQPTVETRPKGRLKKTNPKEENIVENSTPKVPKKRGRPRKYPLVEKPDTLSPILETTLDKFEERMKVLNSELEPISDKSSSSFETSPQTSRNQQDANSPIQTSPKKRGRKKKSEERNSENYGAALTPDDLDSLTKAGIFEAVEIETSKSGRKRKKINYYDMENNFLEEELMDRRIKRQKLSTSFSDSEPDKVTLNTEELITKDREQETIEHENEHPNKDEATPKIDEEDGAKKDEKAENEPQENQDQAETEKSEEENVGRKYKYTGETTKMMKSIFSAAFKDSIAKDTSDLENSQSEKSSTPRRGRKRLNDGEKVFHEQEKVTCRACKDEMPNKDWITHNRKVHNNLSWREGENHLNVDDELFLKKTLKPILQEDKKLDCYKCSRSFVTVGDFIIHKEECEGVVLGGQVTCSICQERMDKSKWAFHKRRKHNNLAWRNGDPPLDLGNQSVVLDILNNLYKAKFPLYCYKCNTSKKSVVGFLSHQAQCGLSQEEVKIKCPHCPKKILPVSLQCHIKMVHTNKKEVNKPQKVNEDNEAGLGKRKAAKTAAAMIDSLSKTEPVQESRKYYCNHLSYKENGAIRRFLKKEITQHNSLTCKYENCEIKSENLYEFWNHLNVCEFKLLQFYACTKCCTIRSTEDQVKNHLESEHNITVLTDDNATSEEDEEMEKEELKLRQELNRRRRFECIKMSTNRVIKLKPRFMSSLQPQSIKKLFQCAFEYTLEFCNEHFTQSLLFDSLRYLQSDWNLLEEDLLSSYLPKNEESCEVSRLRVKDFENVLGIEHKFKKFELFEVEQQKGNVTTIFCGGPISAMAWMPTPHILLRCTQVLAVAVLDDFDAKYSVNSNYNEPSVIQFWDFGILKNRIRPVAPELLFCLAIDYGPIWHLEWCPSGCYDENALSNKNQKQRMGLLAVAGSTPDVGIYAVPFLEDQEKGLVYKTKPLMKLRLAVNLDSLKKKIFPTKISWGKASRHKYVAVGYNDGMVALFNLGTTSGIMTFKDQDGVDVLLPCKTIKAHSHYISVLSLIHHGGGSRWLLTGSFDSNVAIWDLTSDMKTISNRKRIITDGGWLTNWVSYALTADESNTRNMMVHTGVVPHRNYLFEPTFVTYSPSSLTTLSSSDWLNGLINGNGEGEILANFLPQLIYSLDSYKRLKNHRFCMGYANLVDKHKSPGERVASDKEKQKSLKPIQGKSQAPDVVSSAYLFSKSKDFCDEYEPLTYKEADEKYALVFCDMILNNFDDFSEKKQDKLSLNTCDLKLSRPNLYPLKKINKICFNPNCQASLYYVTGYQAGFIRLGYVKFLENDKQVV